MSEYNIKDLVKDNYVIFDSFRQGIFYYRLKYTKLTDDGSNLFLNMLFPVPLEDIGTATLLAEDKAITYMRWIRKALEERTFIKQ